MAMKRSPRRRILSIQVLPTLITSANLLAGLLAISYLLDAVDAGARDDLVARDGFILKAGWLIFIGMFCDALDGRIARMTHTTSDFGAQLDSLADVVTFGVAPALIARTALAMEFDWISGKLLVAFGVLYLAGAALRLARYNVESARTAHGGSKHVTKTFRGLPSPAAAGVIASLVLLRNEYGLTSISWMMLLVTPVLGLLMVSRMPYVHLLNRYFEGRRPMVSVVFIVMVIFLGALYFHETVATAFTFYALSGPFLVATYALFGWPAFVGREDDDEEAAVSVDAGGDDDGAPPLMLHVTDPDDEPDGDVRAGSG